MLSVACGDEDSGAKRIPATAARRCVRVFDHELRTFEAVAVVDFRADQILVAHGVNQQGHVVFHHFGVVFVDFFIEREAVLKDLIIDEQNPNLKLRVFVTGGGCSGFQYGFTFDEEVNEDDTKMVKNDVTLLIDAMSYQYLVGAEIDYSDGLEGAQFVIKNPNATSSCGCGNSFSA